MIVRSASPEDATAIAHIHVATWQATYKGIVPQTYLSSLNEADFTSRWTDWLHGDDSISICVAATEETVIGFAAGGPIRKPVSGFDAELYALYVLPGAQRTGAGRRLVSHLAQNLSSQGLLDMLVWVLRDNPAATFYQHLGATLVTEDTVEIGGTLLPEQAFGCPVATLAAAQNETSPA